MGATSRRAFLKRGTGALAGLGLPGSSRAGGLPALPRIGIVGGGLAGTSLGWLLDGVADCVLLEGRSKLGGHADSIAVDVGGEEIVADVGAQFFACRPHPTYSRLLEILGLLAPADPEADATIEVDMSITVTDVLEPLPRFVSPSTARLWPLLAPWNVPGLVAFLAFSLAAEELHRTGDWLVTVEEWLAGLGLAREESERLLLPLVAAMIGCSVEQARALSARSATTFVAQALPERPLDPVRYNNSLIGLGGNVEQIASAAEHLTVHTDAPVRAVLPSGQGGYVIAAANRVVEHVDQVVFCTPAYVTRALLGLIPWQSGARWVLGALEHFRAEISIHRDPVYMPPLGWSAYNAHVVDGHCEASIWYGALRPSVPVQPPLGLFKSWATARPQAPADEVARRRFLHPLITPGFIRAQRLLAAQQGRGGVWFAGSYLKEVDSQETALTTALDVATALFPDAPNVLALKGGD